jgi:hypothetical protein
MAQYSRFLLLHRPGKQVLWTVKVTAKRVAATSKPGGPFEYFFPKRLPIPLELQGLYRVPAGGTITVDGEGFFEQLRDWVDNGYKQG